MRYLSVCSGIEAASVAWHHLGWEPVGFSEIEPFPAAVLAHRFPNIPNYGDMTKHEQWPIERGAIDLLVGGTPCQSFSVAGLRQGLADPRGNLMLTYLAIADRLRPRWLVWENVPGVLSSNGGRDFGTFLGALGKLGYGWAYRVLDAQYLRVGRWPRAVPQRRRRVFVVGRLIERGARDWAAPGEVLALAEGLRRNLEASGKARQGAAADAEGGSGGGCITSHRVAPTLETTAHDYSRADGFTMIAQPTAGTLGTRGLRSHTELDGHGAYIPVAQPMPFAIYGGNKRPDRPEGGFYVRHEDTARTLDSSQGLNPTCSQGGTGVLQPVPFTKSKRAQSTTDDETWVDGMVNPTLSLFDQGDTLATTVAVAFHPTQDPISSTDGSTHCMGTGSSRGDATIAVAHTLRADGHDAGEDGTGRGTPLVPVAPALTATNDPSRSPQSAEVTQQVAAVHASTMTVRRLTPRECERLQGFPDDWTMIPWRGKSPEDCPDGPRYKALGNSMACNCMAWIGERIAAHENQNH